VISDGSFKTINTAVAPFPVLACSAYSASNLTPSLPSHDLNGIGQTSNVVTQSLLSECGYGDSVSSGHSILRLRTLLTIACLLQQLLKTACSAC